MLISVLLKQLRSLLPTLLIIYFPSFLLLVGAGVQKRVPVSHLVRDPAVVTQAPFYLGIISYIGVLIWCAAASICLFCAVLLRHIVSKKWHLFLLCSGLITLMLLVDDLFLLHEKVYRDYLLIPEKITLLAYGAIVLLYLMVFRKTILQTNFLLMVFAFTFFASSIGIDLISANDSQIGFLLEDGAKFLGIIGWSAYLVNLCLQMVRFRELESRQELR